MICCIDVVADEGASGPGKGGAGLRIAVDAPARKSVPGKILRVSSNELQLSIGIIHLVEPLLGEGLMVDESLWRKFYRTTEVPPLPCPRCETGKVRLVADSLDMRVARHLLPRCEEEYDCPREGSGTFTCSLICDVADCGEVVAVSGETWEREDLACYGDGGTEVLVPLGMTPAPPIIRMPHTLPLEIRTTLLTAFSLFWVDPAACANRLRTCAEKIIAHHEPGNGNKNLHKLLILFSGRSLEHSRTLGALRLVGNSASHGGKVDRLTLVKMFMLLEDALQDLFDAEASVDLSELADRVAKTEGALMIEGGFRGFARMQNQGY